MAKYIFVTGGVVSSLGKGLMSASLGAVLQSRGLKVNILKMDPYLNIDPGTMSPYEHGEVFVTNDGAETDLDLGHYERFLNKNLTNSNNYTSGQIYNAVLHKERLGKYLGKTVQVVPHITDYTKELIYSGGDGFDICIVEVGGTIGDIESLPFLETIRQIKLEKPDSISIHLVYVPFIKVANEIKTKPAQHSVKDLRAIGIQPDIVACRSEEALDESVKKKIALHTNVPIPGVISLADASSIYKIPLVIKEQRVDDYILNKLQINAKDANLSAFEELVQKETNSAKEVNIALIGKYAEYGDSYKSVIEALKHSAIYANAKLKLTFVDADKEFNADEIAANYDGIIVPGGFGTRGVAGKIKAINIARTKKIPYLGICLGMQLAVIEYAQSLGFKAFSTEFEPKCEFPLVSLLSEWQDLNATEIKSTSTDVIGGTLRLGGQECSLKQDSKAFKAYKLENIIERHRHRYEVNNRLFEKIAGNMQATGVSKQGLIEIVEILDHPWFVACQYHPEFTSRPVTGHPLFNDFIKASLLYGNK